MPEQPSAAAAPRPAPRRVTLVPGRPGLAPLTASLEVLPTRVDRVPGWLPTLTGRQLAGTACVVCGEPLVTDSVGIGAVRQTLPSGKEIVYPVRGCAARCSAPRRPQQMPRPLGRRPGGGSR